MSSVAPLLARRALGDRVFLVGVALWVVSILPSLLPVLPPDWTFTYADQFSDVPVLIALLALMARSAGRTPSERERRFWWLWSASVGALLLVRTAYLVVPERFWFTDRADLVEDALYVASYVFAALAVEVRPDRVHDRDVHARLAGVERTGVLVFVLGLVTYFVLVPRTFEPEVYASWAPSLFLFAALDVLLAARIVMVLRTTTSPVWRTVYGLMGLAYALWSVSDAAEALLYMEVLPWVDPGTPADLVWHLPLLPLLPAVSARRWIPAGVAPGALESAPPGPQPPVTLEPERSRLGLLALALPTLHLAMNVLGGRHPALTQPREVALLFTLGGLVGLMMVRHRLVCSLARTLEVDREAMVDQLRAAQRMEAIGRLAAGVAHDFSNVLSVIRGRAAVLLQGGQVARLGREDLEEIVDASERGESLVRSLLALSRDDPTRPEVLDASQVFQELVPVLQRVLPESVEIRTAPLPSRPPTVLMERVHLQQIILNLLVNARDALPTGGRVEVAFDVEEVDDRFAAVHGAASGGIYTVLRVSDTGPGVPPELRPFVFEPLFTTKPQEEGSGLGLAVVFSVAARYGGFARVGDAAAGGACFEVYIPWHDAPAPEQSRSGASSPGSHTVLVVEGDAALRATAARVLEHAGYRVLRAATGGEALEILERRHERIRVLVTDLVLADMPGGELVRRAQRSDPELGAVAMGFEDGSVTQPVPRGIPVVFKPFTPADLVHAVRRASVVRLVQG